MALAGKRGEGGFTLVELMVVVAIVAVLAAVAVVSVSRTSYSRGVQGLAEQVGALAETARMRAIANGRWQQIEYDAALRRIVHWEADYRGMRVPSPGDLWNSVRVLGLEQGVEVAAIDTRTHDQENSGVGAGSFPTQRVYFLPDGTIDGNDPPDVNAASGATYFIRDPGGGEHYRVAIFRASGVAYVLRNW